MTGTLLDTDELLDSFGLVIRKDAGGNYSLLKKSDDKDKEELADSDCVTQYLFAWDRRGGDRYPGHAIIDKLDLWNKMREQSPQ